MGTPAKGRFAARHHMCSISPSPRVFSSPRASRSSFDGRTSTLSIMLIWHCPLCRSMSQAPDKSRRQRAPCARCNWGFTSGFRSWFTSVPQLRQSIGAAGISGETSIPDCNPNKSRKSALRQVSEFRNGNRRLIEKQPSGLVPKGGRIRIPYTEVFKILLNAQAMIVPGRFITIFDLAEGRLRIADSSGHHPCTRTKIISGLARITEKWPQIDVPLSTQRGRAGQGHGASSQRSSGKLR